MVSGLGVLDGVTWSFDSVCINITHEYLDNIHLEFWPAGGLPKVDQSGPWSAIAKFLERNW